MFYATTEDGATISQSKDYLDALARAVNTIASERGLSAAGIMSARFGGLSHIINAASSQGIRLIDAVRYAKDKLHDEKQHDDGYCQGSCGTLHLATAVRA
jgi:hypothetical protein